MGNKPARIRLPLIDQVDAWAHYDNGEWHIEQIKYTLPGAELKSIDEFVNDIKRNKKVDVPTEQWQKNVERQINEAHFDSVRLATLEKEFIALIKRVEELENTEIMDGTGTMLTLKEWRKLFKNDADK